MQSFQFTFLQFHVAQHFLQGLVELALLNLPATVGCGPMLEDSHDVSLHFFEVALDILQFLLQHPDNALLLGVHLLQIVYLLFQTPDLFQVFLLLLDCDGLQVVAVGIVELRLHSHQRLAAVVLPDVAEVQVFLQQKELLLLQLLLVDVLLLLPGLVVAALVFFMFEFELSLRIVAPVRELLHFILDRPLFLALAGIKFIGENILLGDLFMRFGEKLQIAVRAMMVLPELRPQRLHL